METNAKISIRIHEHNLKNKNKDQNRQTRADCKNISKEHKQKNWFTFFLHFL